MSSDQAEFQIRLVDDRLSPQQLENFAMMLRHSIKQRWGNVVAEYDPSDTKGIDPTVAGILVISILPTLLTKVLEFLHAWAMRRENRQIKVRLQVAEASLLEIEVPQTSSPEEVAKWIEMVRYSIIKKAATGKRV